MEMLIEASNAMPELSTLVFSTNSGEDALLTAAKAGHHCAFVELCKRSSPTIYRAVYRIVKCPQDAEDALQYSLMKAFRGLPNFDQRSSFSTWITRIGINSAFMILRKRAKYREGPRSCPPFEDRLPLDIEIADSAPNQEVLCIQAERVSNLHQAIGHLPPSLRCVIELQHFMGASIEEIAEHLNISAPAVKSRLLRGRIALRRLLESETAA